MKAIILILLIIAIAVIIALIRTNSDLRFDLEQQQQEIEASANYIELLTAELLKNGAKSHDHDQEETQDHLSGFLNEVKNDSVMNIPKDQDRNKIFIPDHIPVVGEFVVSQRFKEGHAAIDLAASLGSRVVAAATGEIISVKQDKYFGNMIIMDHFNGTLTVYAHLAKILGEEGSIVKKGSNIGLVGNTGNSTGPHLHFEIIQNGKAIDPEEFIDFSDI